MNAVHLEGGDKVFFEIQDDPPGTILLIPMEVAQQVWEAGKRRLAADRQAEGQASETS